MKNWFFVSFIIRIYHCVFGYQKLYIIILKISYMDDSKMENQEFKLINLKSVVIGSIITVVGFIIAFGLDFLRFYFNLTANLSLIALGILILAPLIAGLIVAYRDEPTYKFGIINGIFAVIIGLILFNLVSFVIGVIRGIHYTNIDYLILSRMLYLIPIIILGIFGAFIGTSIKKLKLRNNN